MKSKSKKVPDTLEQFLAKIEDFSARIEGLAENVSKLKSVNNRLLNEPSQTEREKHLSSQAEIIRQNKIVGRKLKKEIQEEKTRLSKQDQSETERTIKTTQLQTTSKRFLAVWTEYNNVQVEVRDNSRKALLRKMRIVDPNSSLTAEQLETKLDHGDITVVSSIIKESNQAKEDLKLLQSRHNEFVKLEKGILEINEMFLDLHHLVETQGEAVDRIDLQVGQARDQVESGLDQLKEAEGKKKSARRKKFILAAILAGVALVVIIILLVSFL